jgi:hypothetical protein
MQRLQVPFNNANALQAILANVNMPWERCMLNSRCRSGVHFGEVVAEVAGCWLYQWAWNWNDLSVWLVKMGLMSALTTIDTSEDPMLATVLDWLVVTQERTNVAKLEMCLEEAALDPKFLRSILEALRRAPDLLMPPDLARLESFRGGPSESRKPNGR